MRPVLALLQITQFQIRDNPANGLLLFVGIGVVILGFFFINRYSKKALAKSGSGGSVGPKRLFSNSDLQNAAKSLGLNAAQTTMLDFVLRNAAVTNAKTDMADPDVVDGHFEKAYRTIREGSEAEEAVQNRIALLFSTRNSIEAAHTAASGQSKGKVQRRFKRKEAAISCKLYTVRLEETGKKKERKMVVEKRSVPGSIQDISVGGCAIQSNASIPAGTRLKITFDHSGASLAVLGQILRVNKDDGANAVIHVKFTKVPRKAMNSINAIVFEYNDN
ncbi:hypothetical protein FACS1894142_1770 [Spirochaetia bacterium]|nr:hypothetical protein FACS1894142_1770 [Spirochaetia bacterium]